jgi:putative CRISPR-associated protein (TIGR02619 family)
MGCPELRRFQEHGSVWDEDTEQLRGEISARLKRYDLASAAGRVTASAELNSLHRLGLNENDEVVLLATDTADGRACAETLSQIIQQQWRGTRTVVERIMGLQVRDAETLRQVGLPRLVKALLRYVEDPQRRYGGGLVLNPTGGFKGVVPFLTVIGMLYQIPTVYVFEFSEALIRLPALPIGFDLQLFLRARPAVAALRQAGGVIPVEQFYARIPGLAEEERAQLQSLLEVDGLDCTLSPMAEVLAQMEEAGRKKLWLAPEVREQLDGTLGLPRKRLEAGLIRLTDPLWRIAQSHRFQKCELHVFGNSRLPFRIAAFFREDRAYVCRLREVTEHDDYEAEFARLKLRDFQGRTDFAEWTPPIAEDELDLAEQDELESLRTQVRAIPESIAVATEPLREAINDLQRAKEKATSKQVKLQAEIAALRKQLKHAQQQAHQTKAKPRADATGNQSTVEITLPSPDAPPPELKGTIQDATYVGDRLKGSLLVFQISRAGSTWEGCLPITAVSGFGLLLPGAIVKLRVTGIAGKSLQFAAPR